MAQFLGSTPIHGEVDFHSRRDALSIAMSGEELVVEFGEFLLSGVFDENSLEVLFESGDSRRIAVPFFDDREGERFEHEGDGGGICALPKGLFGERKRLALFQGYGKLIEGSSAGEDGIE